MNAPKAVGWILVGLLAWPLAATADVLRFMHTDLSGSVVAVTDESGAIIERRVYEPYGLPTAPIPDGPGYTGHDMDGETGLVYMQQRYYDPEIGRFLSIDPDPVNTSSAYNFGRYYYAGNNPYTYTDPDGEAVQYLIKAAVDFTLEVGIQHATTGEVDLGAAATTTAVGLLNPLKTIQRVKELGKAAKAAKGGAKASRGTADTNRAASRAKGIPDGQIGPSGKPKVHSVQHSTTKSSEEAALRQTPEGGKVRFDAHPKNGQKPHFQAEDAKGENVKPVVHHCPPGKRC